MLGRPDVPIRRARLYGFTQQGRPEGLYGLYGFGSGSFSFRFSPILNLKSWRSRSTYQVRCIRCSDLFFANCPVERPSPERYLQTKEKASSSQLARVLFRSMNPLALSYPVYSKPNSCSAELEALEESYFPNSAKGISCK